MSKLRDLPSISKLLQLDDVISLMSQFGHPLTTQALRSVLDEARSNFETDQSLPTMPEILDKAHLLLIRWTTPTLKPVINATGVLIHTNLGRAPLSKDVIRALQTAATGYSNLEFDLNKGVRGSRLDHARELLIKLTGAEDALVVNNNASAVLLILTALAKRRRVLIARSQLVEIGGGFRIPDIMIQSGAKLIEVGTTNRVHLQDYSDAIYSQPIKLVMLVHQSNFEIVGFHTEPTIDEVVNIAHNAGIPIIEDLGSGTLIDTTPYGLKHEPTVQESLEAGVDLVCFSGDKLLGGPQAGIIVGRSKYITKLRKNALARAIRADKLALSALSATLLHYVKDEVLKKIPIWRMIAIDENELEARVKKWAVNIGDRCEILKGESVVGGGSLPGQTLPTFNLAIKTDNPIRFNAKLRSNDPPIVARVMDDMVIFDPRSVLPEEDEFLISSVKKITLLKES